jgi:hypothetical protein
VTFFRESYSLIGNISGSLVDLPVSVYLLSLIKIMTFSLLNNFYFIVSVLVFCVVMPYGLVDRYQHFGGTYCLHLWPSETLVCWYVPASPHNITTHKTNVDIFTALKTSNLIYLIVLSSFLHTKVWG